ncbi:MAG: hypothetical protein ACXAC8_04745 [Candidatus Hodarchaeales archaeon]
MQLLIHLGLIQRGTGWRGHLIARAQVFPLTLMHHLLIMLYMLQPKV